MLRAEITRQRFARVFFFFFRISPDSKYLFPGCCQTLCLKYLHDIITKTLDTTYRASAGYSTALCHPRRSDICSGYVGGRLLLSTPSMQYIVLRVIDRYGKHFRPHDYTWANVYYTCSGDFITTLEPTTLNTATLHFYY